MGAWEAGSKPSRSGRDRPQGVRDFDGEIRDRATDQAERRCSRVINLEMFCCSGGMAAGFRAAGIEFGLAVDFARDHCDSYEANLGHRPEQMDVRVLLAEIRAGRRVLDIDLLVADPPCTPWSRAGKRLGTADDRDMLEVTCEIIAALRPRRYLIGNVPGLEDGVNLHVVHRTIAELGKLGYCVADFLSLDAASYGVPQHRWRPFWFGHREGPCLRPPVPTHCDPLSLATLTLPGFTPLQPWVTCRDALGHLSPEELGRAVKMRRREQNGAQLGSVPGRPARVVGTSNLSDGNVLTMPERHERPVHTSDEDSPARSLTTQCRSPGHTSTIVLNQRHRPADAPAPTLGAKYRGQGAQVLSLAEPTSKHPAATPDAPSPTIRAGGSGHTGPHVMLAAESGRKKRPPSTKGPQSTRKMVPDAPSTTVQAREDRVGSGSPVLEWPWPRPATTVSTRASIAPPGHHDESYSIMSLPDAVILSERAAMILQGFRDGWTIVGVTKKARWSQIGQAIPPALAEAVARAIVEQDEAAAQLARSGGDRHVAAMARGKR